MAALITSRRLIGYAVAAGLLVAMPLVSGCGGGATAEHGTKSPEAQQHEKEMMEKYKQQYQQHPIPSMRGPGNRPSNIPGGPGGMPGGTSGAPR